MAHNILIVDDSALTRMSIKRIIDMVDIEVDQVQEAENGVKALEILAGGNIDLVLADLNMPEMGGVELVHRIKKDHDCPDVPVVVISTESSTTRIKELIDDGVADFLHKPFTPEEFRSKLANTLVTQK